MPTPVEAFTPRDRRRKPPSTPSTTPVLLHDWWLVKADSGRLGVQGFNYKRSRAIRCFSSAPIVKRRDAVTIETVDGMTVLLHGHLNRSRTLENGFSGEVCDDFLIGFPYYWEEFAAVSVSEEPSLFSVPKGTYSSDAYKTPDPGDHKNVIYNAMQTEDEIPDAYKTPDPRDYINVSDDDMQTNDDDASVSDNIMQTNTSDICHHSGASSAGKRSSQPRENMVITPDRTPLNSKKEKPSKKVKPKQKKKSGNNVADVVRSGPLTRSRTRLLNSSVRTGSTSSKMLMEL